MDPIKFRKTVIISVALIVCAALAIAAVLWKMRDDALTHLDQELGAMATILADQTERSSQVIDIMLDEIVVRATELGQGTEDTYVAAAQKQAVFFELQERLIRMPQADVITLTDARGRVLSITRSWPTPAINLSDRDYFKHVSSHPGRALFVSLPVQNRVTGAWTVYFAKRIESRQGAFLGLALIGFRPEYFLRTLDVITSFPGRSLLLSRIDGTVLLRHPDKINRVASVIPPDSPWHAIASTGGMYHSPGIYDGIAVRVAVRPTGTYPLVINVAGREQPVLDAWRMRAWAIGGIGTLITVMLTAAILALHAQYGRVDRSRRALAEKTRETSVANTRFYAALASMSHGLAMFDRRGELLIHNEKFSRLLGMDMRDLHTHRPFADVLSLGLQRCRTRVCEKGKPIGAPGSDPEAGASETWDLYNGRSLCVTIDPVPGGGSVMTCEDITERRISNTRIEWLAHNDTLTALANRTRFVECLEKVIAGPAECECAVIMLDLDRFKEVNDTFGHGAGDALLCKVAERLRTTASDAQIVARLGGDEFALIIQADQDVLLSAGAFAAKILTALTKPYHIGDADLTVGASIGIARFRAGADVAIDAGVMMRRADLALYQAKSDGRGVCRVFEQAMETEYLYRQSLISDLRQAPLRNELSLYYQPIISAGSRKIVAMEALLRWNHPIHGAVSPAVFIPLAEESGLISVLGDWVLQMACRDAALWRDDIKVAVNISPLQIAQGELPTFVAQTLAATGLEAHRLKMEITESVLLGDTDRSTAVLSALQHQGVVIVLDDFGTGYSSLSYLKSFPFGEIKIDRSFVEDIAHRGCAALVSATAMVAREFGMAVTAEGVETAEQESALLSAGIGQLQGYRFGRPAPEAFWADRLHDTAFGLASSQ